MRKKLPPLSCTSCILHPHACLKNVHRKLTPVLPATAMFKWFLHLPTLSMIYREICPHKHTHENWRNTRDWQNTSPLLMCPSLILLKSLWPPIHVASQPSHFPRRRSIYFPTHHNVFLFFFVSFLYACALYADNLWWPQKEHYYTPKKLHVLTLNSGHWYKSFIYIFSTEKNKRTIVGYMYKQIF